MTRLSPVAFALALAAFGTSSFAEAAVGTAPAHGRTVQQIEIAKGPGVGRCTVPASAAATADSVTVRTARANPSNGGPALLDADATTTDAVSARVARARPAGAAMPAPADSTAQAGAGCNGGTMVM